MYLKFSTLRQSSSSIENRILGSAKKWAQQKMQLTKIKCTYLTQNSMLSSLVTFIFSYSTENMAKFQS